MYNTGEIVVHVIAVCFIMVSGCVGNGLVIRLYGDKRKAYPNREFVIAFALLDLFGCLILAPQIAMLRWFLYLYELGNTVWIKIFFTTFSFVTLAYLCILDAVALERVWAVFRPYKFRPSKKRTCVIIMSTTSTCALQSFVMPFALPNHADVMNRIVISRVVLL